MSLYQEENLSFITLSAFSKHAEQLFYLKLLFKTTPIIIKFVPTILWQGIARAMVQPCKQKLLLSKLAVSKNQANSLKKFVRNNVFIAFQDVGPKFKKKQFRHKFWNRFCTWNSKKPNNRWPQMILSSLICHSFQEHPFSRNISRWLFQLIHISMLHN